MGKFKDLTGQRFGRLSVIERVENNNGSAMWLCKCDCGNVKIVEGNKLISGNTQSCGCLRRERSASSHPRRPKGSAQDLTGKKFGKLTVLERGNDVYYGKDKQQKPAWWCVCECGMVKLVPGHLLRAGRVQSCGQPECRYWKRKNNIE